MRNARHSAKGRAAGFSLIELLVVVAIIAILAGTMIPAISHYFRIFKIRGASQQVAGAIQQARNKAIAKNVNWGVDFVIQDSRNYWVHIEDDQSAAHDGQQQTLDFAAPDGGQSVRGTLPEGVRFAATAAECPASTLSLVGAPTAFDPNAGWLRYTRLGAICTSSCGSLPLASGAALTTLFSSGSGIAVCLYQPITGLSRALLVSPGGRVRTQQ